MLYICPMMLYNSEKTIIPTIVFTRNSIPPIPVRFSHATTMKGRSHLENFFTRPRSRFLLSIFSPLALADIIPNTKSRINITVMMMIPSPLMEKYSRICATDIPPRIHRIAHSVCVMVFNIIQINCFDYSNWMRSDMLKAMMMELLFLIHIKYLLHTQQSLLHFI